jgi:hypothetical protein
MSRIRPVAAILAAVAVVAAAPPALDASRPSPAAAVDIAVDGLVLPQYRAFGTLYVEAMKARPYAIRLHNPYDVRVAVALSVDGLNSIDARRTTAAAARKWVIDPHQTITISGWQVSMNEARRFFFTTEDRSYATRLGQPDNQGVISAVFFRELRPVRIVPLAQDNAAGKTRRRPPAAAEANSAAPAGAAEQYAATGIGQRTQHPVEQVRMNLEPFPAATIEIRYEYRSQLVRLGILPDALTPADPLTRRQKAQGFDKGFCPDIR